MTDQPLDLDAIRLRAYRATGEFHLWEKSVRSSNAWAHIESTIGDIPALIAEVERLREALSIAYEFLGTVHDPTRESSVPGQTTCVTCRALDIARAALEGAQKDTAE